MRGTTLFKAVRSAVTALPVIVNVLFAVTGIVYVATGVNLSPHWYALFGHSVAYSTLLLGLSVLFRNCLWHQALCISALLGIISEEFSVEGLINISLSFYLSAGLAIFGLIISATLRLGWIRFTKASRNRYGTSPVGSMTGTAKPYPTRNTLKWRAVFGRSTKS